MKLFSSFHVFHYFHRKNFRIKISRWEGTFAWLSFRMMAQFTSPKQSRRLFLSDIVTNNRVDLSFILYNMISQYFISYFFINLEGLSINFCVNFLCISLSHFLIGVFIFFLLTWQTSFWFKDPFNMYASNIFLTLSVLFVTDIFDHIRFYFLYFSFVLFGSTICHLTSQSLLFIISIQGIRCMKAFFTSILQKYHLIFYSGYFTVPFFTLKIFNLARI